MILKFDRTHKKIDPNQTCFSRTLLLTIWLTSSCGCRHRQLITVSFSTDWVIFCVMRPHHTDELDELKTYSNNHRVLEMIDWSDNLIVTSEKGFNQTSFIR